MSRKLLIAIFLSISTVVLLIAMPGATKSCPTGGSEMVTRGNICYPANIEKPLLEAYRHFPELKDNKIFFRYAEDFSSSYMQAQPLIGSLLKDKGKREYVIRMKPYLIIAGDSLPLNKVPDKVLTGWLGHEMGHLVDYHQRSSFNLLFLGLRYLLSPNAVIIAEETADHYAIDHGLGAEIIATKEYILKDQDFPQWYQDRIERYYLTADDVREYLQEKDN